MVGSRATAQPWCLGRLWVADWAMFDMDGYAYHYHNVAYGGIALTVTWAGTRHASGRQK